MGEPLDTPASTAGMRPARPAEFATLNNPTFVASLFVGMTALQALGFWILGTNRAGSGFSELILCCQTVPAIACCWLAFRRAQGTAAWFWFLFVLSLTCLFIPTALWAASTILGFTLLSASTWRVLYCLYGIPIVMMLLLPETDQQGRQNAQIALDQFQVAIVVGLAYSTFFYLPLQRLLPSDALVRNLIVSNLQSLFLLVGVLVRLQFARTANSRSLIERLAIFVLSCATVTLIGNWIDLHGFTTASTWFDLGWALSYPGAALAALHWKPDPEPPFDSEPATFLSYLGANLVLVAVLLCLILMLDPWKRAHGALLTNAAFAASLIAFTFRLALTQYGHQQEIVGRKAAQEDLSIANETIGGLLEEARIEANSIAQISELGTLLQACSSREEAFQLVPERLVHLFPGTSGALSLLNVSRNRVETVAQWGPHPPPDLPFISTVSQDLPSGDGRAVERESSAPRRREQLHSGEAPLSFPLIANDEAIGVLLLYDVSQATDSFRPSHHVETTRRQRLAPALAEHIALTIANLDLREALHVQAIRDPLTGLYNRRYMQEFLDREIHRALRRERPLSLMMLDVDHFKRYNDTFGHPAGDDALRLVGDALVSSVRAEDLACRYGGEEFVVVLTECRLQQAAVRAEEVRTRLKRLYVERPGELPGPVTVSIGVASFQETTDQAELLIKCADGALYQAKHAGRDRVVVASPEQPDATRSFDSQGESAHVAAAPPSSRPS